MAAVNGPAVQTSPSGNGQHNSSSEAAGPAAAAFLQEFLQVDRGSAQAWGKLGLPPVASTCWHTVAAALLCVT
jgi:hypothetical protein